jgi:hypothetical protein
LQSKYVLQGEVIGQFCFGMFSRHFIGLTKNTPLISGI